ncbi:MAG: hypothetical protein EA369_07670 [Bradymonadales bacterium]|nr:MAG: hypothetical protein EA369_07670 [Bradymonadales bacterium]
MPSLQGSVDQITVIGASRPMALSMSFGRQPVGLFERLGRETKYIVNGARRSGPWKRSKLFGILGGPQRMLPKLMMLNSGVKEPI